MLILAHRGASRDAPENTLRAFTEAVRQGADGVELDVQVCASGEVVVCHDPSLERLAGVDWEIRGTPWWKLRTLDVGSRLGFGPERIPLFAEVLELLPPAMLINVELKCETVDDHGLTGRALAVIRDLRAEERVLVSSFNPLCLFRLAALAPNVRRGYLLDPARSFALHGRALAPLVASHSIHPHFSQITEARARTWHAGGYRLAVWTVDEPAEARRLRALGVEYLITNRPALMRAALQ
ncbi:MAG: glycerophosphodiester phosphodiesterase [Myxococcaceae bacterium]|nr:glycerophosphodiester phosphodiesterase [Myxococcaceae bacterium]